MREPLIVGSEREKPAKLRPPARLKKRADFVRTAKGRRAKEPSFSLQAARRTGAEGPPRFGFTVTKKVGGAVIRNRIRRRLKEALRLSPVLSARPGYDYVILGREAALNQDFAALKDSLARAIADIHGEKERAPRISRRPTYTASTMKD
ncbi:MAG TPA: ribonuclease P protein component [Methylovirgula sp.]|jgi:ribonuclease P protein component